MIRITYLKIGYALAAVLALAGCVTGYQYRAVASGGDYYLADEVAAPYSVAPYGTLGYGWPGGWYGNLGLSFGGYYGLGGFYGPSVYAPGVWYGPRRYGSRWPYHYRPRPRHPAPKAVARPHERRALPPREHWRDGWRKPHPQREHPRYRRQDQAVVSAEDGVLPGRGWRSRMPGADGNGRKQPVRMNGAPAHRPPDISGNRPRRAVPVASGMPMARPAQVAPRGVWPGANAMQPRQLRAAPAAAGIRPVAPAPARRSQMPSAPKPMTTAPAPRPPQAAPSAPRPAAASAPRPLRTAPPPRRAAAPAPRGPGRENHRLRER